MAAAAAGGTAPQPPVPSPSWARTGEVAALLAAAVVTLLTAFSMEYLGLSAGHAAGLLTVTVALTVIAGFFHRVDHGVSVLTAAQDALEAAPVGRP